MLADAVVYPRQFLNEFRIPHGFIEVFYWLQAQQDRVDDPLFLDRWPFFDILNEVAHKLLDWFWVISDQLVEVSVFLLVIELLAVEYLLWEQSNDGDIEIFYIRTHSVLFLKHSHKFGKQQLWINNFVEKCFDIFVLYLPVLTFCKSVVLSHDELYLLWNCIVALQNLIDEWNKNWLYFTPVLQYLLPN